MKKLILLLLLISCQGQQESKYYQKIILNKRYQNSFNNDLPKGLCNLYIGNENYFQDSCKFYYIGDTIGVTKRK